MGQELTEKGNETTRQEEQNYSRRKTELVYDKGLLRVEVLHKQKDSVKKYRMNVILGQLMRKSVIDIVRYSLFAEGEVS